jgi:hypothetical protein
MTKTVEIEPQYIARAIKQTATYCPSVYISVALPFNLVGPCMLTAAVPVSVQEMWWLLVGPLIPTHQSVCQPLHRHPANIVAKK